MNKTEVGRDLRPFRRRPGTEVVAVKLDFDTEGFTYRKWGGVQACKPGDWIVDNGQDVYTVDGDVFEATYEPLGRGLFAKRGLVWARVAEDGGRIPTKEGATDYRAGDYLVFNDPGGEDGWAVSRKRFEELYEPAPLP